MAMLRRYLFFFRPYVVVANEGRAQARALVHKSNGIDRTLALAKSFCDTAREAISSFPSSEAKDGLEEVLEMVLTRKR